MARTKTRPKAIRANEPFARIPIAVPAPPANNRFTHIEIRTIKAALRERMSWRAFRGRQRRPTHGMPEGIIGIGFGWKRTEGKQSAINCIRVYVKRKLALKRLPVRMRIPGSLESIPTDVIPIGKIRAHHGAAQCGTSIGDHAGHRGTLGCLVTDGRSQYFLGSWHVMDYQNTADGSPVFMPALGSGGNFQRVGQITCCLQLVDDGSTPNSIDAAIASLAPGIAPDPRLPRLGQVSQTPEDLSGPQDQLPTVTIDGCATQNQSGVIEAVAEDVLVEYYNNPSSIGFLTNQIGIVGTAGDFSQETDSGALVVTENGINPVGILVGGGTTTDKIPVPHSFASPINKIFDHYQVTLA